MSTPVSVTVTVGTDHGKTWVGGSPERSSRLFQCPVTFLVTPSTVTEEGPQTDPPGHSFLSGCAVTSGTTAMASVTTVCVRRRGGGRASTSTSLSSGRSVLFDNPGWTCNTGKGRRHRHLHPGSYSFLTSPVYESVFPVT